MSHFFFPPPPTFSILHDLQVSSFQLILSFSTQIFTTLHEHDNYHSYENMKLWPLEMYFMKMNPLINCVPFLSLSLAVLIQKKHAQEWLISFEHRTRRLTYSSFKTSFPFHEDRSLPQLLNWIRSRNWSSKNNFQHDDICSTCVLRLTRVRTRTYVRLSVSCVCIMSCVCPSRVSASFLASHFEIQVFKSRLTSMFQLIWLDLQERSRSCRWKLWKTASSDCQSDSLFNPHASLLIQRLFLTDRGAVRSDLYVVADRSI